MYLNKIQAQLASNKENEEQKINTKICEELQRINELYKKTSSKTYFFAVSGKTKNDLQEEAKKLTEKIVLVDKEHASLLNLTKEYNFFALDETIKELNIERQKYQAELQNIKQMVAIDSGIITYLLANIDILEKLKGIMTNNTECFIGMADLGAKLDKFIADIYGYCIEGAMRLQPEKRKYEPCFYQLKDKCEKKYSVLGKREEIITFARTYELFDQLSNVLLKLRKVIFLAYNEKVNLNTANARANLVVLELDKLHKHINRIHQEVKSQAKSEGLVAADSAVADSGLYSTVNMNSYSALK